MNWALLTPYRSAAWDGERLLFGAGTRRQNAPRGAAAEAAWRGYFAAIFAPPGSAGRNLVAVRVIPSLIQGARQAEVDRMAHAEPVRSDPDPEPDIGSLAEAAAAAASCRRCPLYAHATQTVFGAGPEGAEVMFVGEQPGDREDLAGAPFVGPAGQLFDRALATVGIDRRRVYVTNAVKHFKFTPRGKRRIHSKPNAGEIAACRFWLDLERRLVRPRLIVALGATAAQSLTGKAAPIAARRGRKLELPDGAALLVTVHPSYLLRLPDRDRAAEELRRFEADLRAVKAFIDRRGHAARGSGPVAA
jgi:DNA polymerase